MELASLVEFKVIRWSSRHLDCVGVSDQAFKSDLHSFPLTKSLFNEVRLTLKEDELAIRKDVFLEELGNGIIL